MPLTAQQEDLCSQNTTDFSDLKAVTVNCSLKRNPDESHTRLLLSVSEEIMRKSSVSVQSIHALSHQIAPGVYPDMTEHGWDRDDWPELWPSIEGADILILATPIWLGEESSVCRILIERLYGMSGMLNAKGQSLYYGKAGGTVVTGNEDGVKHCAMNILFSLSHIGYTVPPQADAGWMGEAGPGPSYMDPGSGGPENDFTNRNTTFLVWNCLHLARMLKDAGGIPAHGNQPEAWDAGCKTDFHSPEHKR